MNAEEYDDQESEFEESPREPLSARVAEIAQRRWVQAVLVVLFGCVAIGTSAAILKPKTEKVKDPKFLACPKCDHEIKFADIMVGEPCVKCREDPVGKYEPRATSIKDELSRKSPWRWFHLAAALEGIVTIGLVLYVFQRRERDPSNTYYVFSCPYCSQRLRFRHLSLGGLGQCSRCKRPVRFPTRESAVLEDDLIREEQARLESEDQENEDEE